MAIDRDDTLRKAEKLLRQGRLDAAIAEFERLVEACPRDWSTLNTLGDLLVRAGRVEAAAGYYARLAQHFASEGFLQKAAALYKKIVRIKPDDEQAWLQAADLSECQGLVADAKRCLVAVAELRGRRGDRRGAAEIAQRLAALETGDQAAGPAAAKGAPVVVDPRIAMARLKATAADALRRGRPDESLGMLAAAAALDRGDAEVKRLLLQACLQAGQFKRAREYASTAEEFRTIAAASTAAGDEREALAALEAACRLEPGNHDTHVQIARLHLAAGRIEQARACLAETDATIDDPAAELLQLELHVRAGAADNARPLIRKLVRAGADHREHVIDLGWRLTAECGESAFVVFESVADEIMAEGDGLAAATLLRSYVQQMPVCVPALVKLVEIAVDAGLDSTMYSAQAQLADAYLAHGCGREARVIAEDLVAREPWQRTHIDRLRRALVLLGEPEPDRVIADCLSSDSTFLGRQWPDGDSLGAVMEPASALSMPVVVDRDTETAAVLADMSSSGEGCVLADRAQEAGPPGGSVADLAIESGTPATIDVDLSAALDELRAGPVAAVAATDGSEAEVRLETADLERVFELFREEAAALGLEDFACHQFRLGLTYRDMGMPDAAAASLVQAVRAPRYRFQAASLLAQICREQGKMNDAVEWFEQAAEAPAPTVEAGRRLLYDLGRTLWEAGEPARALAAFLELRAAAPDYRDVAAWVQQLSSTA